MKELEAVRGLFEITPTGTVRTITKRVGYNSGPLMAGDCPILAAVLTTVNPNEIHPRRSQLARFEVSSFPRNWRNNDALHLAQVLMGWSWDEAMDTVDAADCPKHPRRGELERVLGL